MLTELSCLSLGDLRYSTTHPYQYFNQPNKTDIQRTSLQTFLVCIDNRLKSCVCGRSFPCEDIQGDSLRRRGRDMQHAGIRFQSAVVIIGTHTCVIQMCETGTVIISNSDINSDTCLRRVFRTIDDRNHLDGISAASYQSHDIGSTVRAISEPTDYLFWYNRHIFHLYIYGVWRGSRIKIPLHIDRLHPSLGFSNVHTIVRDSARTALLGSFGKPMFAIVPLYLSALPELGFTVTLSLSTSTLDKEVVL